MAYYSPDHDYIEGKKIVESLDPAIDKERLIKYYVYKLHTNIEELNKKLDEYQAVFNAIDRFLPNHNPRLGGSL